jgi:hypothetical protein
MGSMMPNIGHERFAREDLFIDYRSELMMFRWDHKHRKVFRKFYGETGEDEMPDSSNMFEESMLWGDEITRDQYEKGAKKPEVFGVKSKRGGLSGIFDRIFG